MNSRALFVLLAALVCAPILTAAKKPAAAPAGKNNLESSRTGVRPLSRVVAGSDPIVDVAASGISPNVLKLALSAVECGVASGDLQSPKTLTVIDYSRPSTEPRLWVFDLRTGSLLFKELVAHGRNTGDNMASHFSDQMNSRQSSIGLFRTSDTYIGNNGYSLRLDGLEPGFNGNARPRAIVMHGAPYVSTQFAASQGRIGRSWGCPALREAVARKVIDTIRGGDVIFSYYPDQKWLKTSRFLNCQARTPQSGIFALATN